MANTFHPGKSPGYSPVSGRFFTTPLSTTLLVTTDFPETIAVVRLFPLRQSKTKSQFTKIIKSIVVVISKPKPVKIVSLVKLRRNKPKTTIIQTKHFGKPTTKTVPQKARTLTQAIVRARVKAHTAIVLRKPVRLAIPPLISFPENIAIVKVRQSRKIAKSASLFKKPQSFTPVFATLPIEIVVIGASQKRRALRNRLIKETRIKFTKKFGKPTVAPKVRAPKILTFASQQAMRKKKFVLGKHQIATPIKVAIVVGSTVTFYDGIWVADGLTYHHGLDRPTVVLTPVGGGKYTVVKTSGLSDEIASQLSKETVIIDGDLP